MQLIYKGEGVDIDATFQAIDKRISALEPKTAANSKDWKPAPPKGAKASVLVPVAASAGKWTPAPPKKGW
jgi:hypothetical protein